jgi:CheY-like chemotaxis protein
MDRNILYVDSSKSDQERFSEHLEGKENLSLKTANTVDEAISILEEFRIKCLVTEADLPDSDVGDILDIAADKNPAPIPILFTEKDFDDIPTDDMISFSAYVSKNNEDAYSKVVHELNSLLESRSEIDYPVPENEEKRLPVLEKYDIDELIASGSFDRLSKIGAELFDTQWCFIGLVDDERERFLSFEGSDTEELKRSCTICTFAINDDGVMVVEDRNKDPRFKYVDELEDLGIKWYAGAPIVTESGYKIGAFCVADTEKRNFSQEERKLLQLLSDEAMEKIRLEKKASETIIDKLRNIL